MRWKLPFLICLLFIAANTAIACSCAGIYSWCETISGNSVQLIIKGSVVSVDSTGARVKVLDQIEGTANNDIIRIPHGNGALCYSGLYSNQIGDTVILALSEVDSLDVEFNPDFKIGDYTFYLCGTYILDVKNEIVKGQISGNIQQMHYDQFKNSTIDCPEDLPMYYKLRPNPALASVWITIDPLTLKDITIFNTHGQTVYYNSILPDTNDFQINLKSFLPGLYFVQLRTIYSTSIERLVIQ